MAYHVHRLWRLHRVMQLSLVSTLADKHRTSATKISRQLKTTVSMAHRTLKVLEVRQERGDGTPPLIVRCGGVALRWQKNALLNEHPKEVFGTRSEVVQRLLAQTCERCGSTDDCAVHHMRKRADPHKPGQQERPFWVKRMAARRQKTLVTCRKCHEEMQSERASKHKDHWRAP